MKKNFNSKQSVSWCLSRCVHIKVWHHKNLLEFQDIKVAFWHPDEPGTEAPTECDRTDEHYLKRHSKV